MQCNLKLLHNLKLPHNLRPPHNLNLLRHPSQL